MPHPFWEYNQKVGSGQVIAEEGTASQEIAEMGLEAALAELDLAAPGVPLLALGQTVAWDEPLKGGLARVLARSGSDRRVVFGVHDTDYFAKAPNARPQPGGFASLAHNDTTTRGLWSAAGEFNSLFGSETVITRETYALAGLRLERLSQARPGVLDELTEAWGWRGIVSLDPKPPVTADLKLSLVLPELRATFNWAIDATLDCLTGEGRREATDEAWRLRELITDAANVVGESGTLADLYERMIPGMVSFVTGSEAPIETTRTSRLLRFNPETCHQPRFELLGLFLSSETRERAKAAYNAAVTGSGLYAVERFGTGAIPFDVYIPGVGRGTLRLGAKGAVINTNPASFLTYKRRPETVQELAEILTAKYGSNCAVIGKAVTLIGMLGREFSFVFHEGASSYVKLSKKLHQALGIHVHPILRLRYETWQSLSVGCSWIRLPEPLRRPFGSDELCAPSVAGRWREVGADQVELLRQLGTIRRPIDLIEFLDSHRRGAWKQLAKEYRELHRGLLELRNSVEEVRARRVGLYTQRREMKEARRQAEAALGAHFREFIFEKSPTETELAERERLSHELERVIAEQERVSAELRHAFREQKELASAEAVRKAQSRRRDIEIEAELMRAQIIREAVIASSGLEAANRRPSGWWFPLVSPDGLWYRETLSTAAAYLERLI
jgi:hypothetical protein